MLAVLSLAGCKLPARIQVQEPRQRGTPDAAELGRVRAAFAPALASLRAAIDDGEEDLAFAILGGLRTRGAGDQELQAVLDDFERVLEGRRLVRNLALSLRVEPVAAGALAGVPVRRFRVLLDAANDGTFDVRLHLPPANLQRLRVTIDAQGSQSKDYTTRSRALFEDLLLPAGETVSRELLMYDVPFSSFVAVRDQFGLGLLSGELDRGGERYPAAGLIVRPAVREAIAPFFPTEPLEPQVLLDYAQREVLSLPPLIERAVRIAPERRTEALELLQPLADRLQVEDPERWLAVAPALRWLSGRVEPGAAWTAALRETQADAAREEPSNLDLGGGTAARNDRPRRGELELP